MNLDNPRVRSRKLWDKHGSWLILALVAGIFFNAGIEWNAWKTQDVVETIVKAGVAERDSLRGRLREVNKANLEMAARLAPAVQTAKDAALKADAAATKADAAVDKADKLMKKDED